MELQVGELDEFRDRVTTALDRVTELQAGTRVDSAAFFSERFMAGATEFDSFTDFCDRSPWSLDRPADIQHVPRDELDAYVAEHTEFESWEGMKRQAAEDRIVDQIRS